MTKQEFRSLVTYMTGPDSHMPRWIKGERESAAEVEPFDPKLAELIRAGADAWQRVHEYLKARTLGA